ncbi:hypothetical protein PsYK624_054080 [Phanerochaete sordida]|uniref:Uncharacterized protein n=1 Tax=Phanerochaete sordida TaxID=48140 RepID=A0A9P3G6V3_9APHY|nr:hypothetical protein PsYK624_054080 [Phanerochaete sordida]
MDIHEEDRVILPSFSSLTQDLKVPHPLPSHILALRDIGPLAPAHRAHPGLAFSPFDPNLTIREMMLFDVPDAAEVIEVLMEAHRREWPVEEARKRSETAQHPYSANRTPSTGVEKLDPRTILHRSRSAVTTWSACEGYDSQMSYDHEYEAPHVKAMRGANEHKYRRRVAPGLFIHGSLESNKRRTNNTDATARTADRIPSGRSGSAEHCPRSTPPIEGDSWQQPATLLPPRFSVQQAVLGHVHGERSWADPETRDVRQHFETTYRESMAQPTQLQQVAIPKFADYDVCGPPAQFQIPYTQATVGEQFGRRQPGPKEGRSRRVNSSTAKKSAPRTPAAPASAPNPAIAEPSRTPSPRSFVLSGGVSLYASAGPPVVPDVRDQDVEQLSGPCVAGRKRLRPTYEEIYGNTSVKKRCALYDDEYARR